MRILRNEMMNKDAAIFLLREGISKGCYPEFQIVSNSMYPILKMGDKVSVKEISVKDLSCGDIVL
jgi:hypothetical protein